MSKKPSVTDRAFLATVKAKSGIEGSAAYVPRPMPATAPGSMAAHLARESQVIIENDKLKDELKQWEGALPSKSIDPKLIVPSKWANRDGSSFLTADFAEFKAEIEMSEGNVQPIKIRPVRGDDDEQRYEIVYGHRRHRACLELGIPVNALIEGLADDELFVQMERENRNRKNLSPWEQGKMYARALDEGLFTSNKKLAASIGVNISNLGKSLVLARLPKQIINAFKSPLDLQLRWAPVLKMAYEKNPESVLARAESISGSDEKMKPSEILAGLLNEGSADQPLSHPLSVAPYQFRRNGKAVGEMKMNQNGRVSIKFLVELDEKKQKSLQNLIDTFLSRTD